MNEIPQTSHCHRVCHRVTLHKRHLSLFLSEKVQSTHCGFSSFLQEAVS